MSFTPIINFFKKIQWYGLDYDAAKELKNAYLPPSEMIAPDEFIVNEIITEQFDHSRFEGLWSKNFHSYVVRILSKPKLNTDENKCFYISLSASITCSTTISLDLIKFIKNKPNEKIKTAIKISINRYYNFIMTHSKVDGLGVYKIERDHPLIIEEDLRHTIWGIIFLNALDKDKGLYADYQSILYKASKFVIDKLSSDDWKNERIHTICALYKLISINSLVQYIKTEHSYDIADLEKEVDQIIFEKIKKRTIATELFFSDDVKLIDDIIDIAKFLVGIQISTKLNEQIQLAITNVFSMPCLHVRNDNKVGIKLFTDDTKANIGATAAMIDMAHKYKVLQDIDNIEEYYLYMREEYIKISPDICPWHLSSLLDSFVYTHTFPKT